MTLFAPAVKEQLKARVAIDGPTGSGKTWTALQWARIIAGPNGPIGLVDTENRSAAYYAPAPGTAPERLNWWDPPYEFGHLPVSPPYDPRELTRIIRKAGDELGADGVLVIDSLTHYWNGEGGTLDIVEDAGDRKGGGNRFAGWKEGTPAQRMMLDAIIHAACHVVVTMRSKMEYVLVDYVDKSGAKRSKPDKVGMAPEQRAGVEYEFTVVADMDLEHRLIVSKSRCDVVADRVATNGQSADVAQDFAAWLATGVARIDPTALADLVAQFDKVADETARRALKSAFVDRFGAPAELLTDQVDDARAWVVAQHPAEAGTGVPSAVPAEGTREPDKSDGSRAIRESGPAPATPADGPEDLPVCVCGELRLIGSSQTVAGIVHRLDGPCHLDTNDVHDDAPGDPAP